MSNNANDGTTLDSQALARLAGGLVHELKNPLSTLGLHLDLLREQWDAEDDPRARRTLRTLDLLKKEIGRLDSILEDFLRFTSTDALECRLTDLNELVEHVASFVRPECLAREVRIETFPDLSISAIFMDDERIRQALLNLLINSRQALEEQGGGTISVSTRLAQDEVRIEVVDDGPGMDPDTLARCFEVYFTRKKGGTGLGLPTVQRVAQAHGGNFSLESSPGHGTRAVLHLPLNLSKDIFSA